MANVFNNGDTGSKSVWVKTLQGLISQGQTQLDQINTLETTGLIELNNQLVAVNARNSRTQRIKPVSVVANFAVTDFLTIDQTKTTGTIRIDAGTGTVKERAYPIDLLATQVIFSSSVGTVQVLDTNQNQYLVLNNSAPTGTFNVTLNGNFNISVLVFDILAYASTPALNISLSSDGITFIPATSISINGYRVTAWFDNVPGNQIQVEITPALPDAMYGTQYSFGFSGLAARATAFDLRSLIVSAPVTFNPQSLQVQLKGTEDPRITYFLSLSTDLAGGQGTFNQVNLNTPITLPGVAEVNVTGVTPITITGVFTSTLETNVCLPTLQVIETTGGGSTPMVVVPGLSYSTPNYTDLTGEYIGVSGSNLILVNAGATIVTSRTFKISYLTVASPVTAVLQTLLSTSNQSTTPFYTGAFLEEI